MSSDLVAGDFVWVKTLRMPWWPAVLVRPEDCPLKYISKKSQGWYVKYLGEDEKYECITKQQNIKPFHCSEMDDYIKKGLNLARQRPSDLYLKVIFDKALKIIGRRSQKSYVDTSDLSSEAVSHKMDFLCSTRLPMQNDTELNISATLNAKPNNFLRLNHTRNYSERKEEKDEIQNFKLTKSKKEKLRFRSLSLSPENKKRTCQKFYTPQVTSKKRKRFDESLAEADSQEVGLNKNNIDKHDKTQIEPESTRKDMKTLFQNTANTEQNSKIPVKLIFRKHRLANKSGSVFNHVLVSNVSASSKSSKNDDTLNQSHDTNISVNPDASPQSVCNNHSFAVPNTLPQDKNIETVTYLPKSNSSELDSQTKMQDFVKGDSDCDSDDSDLPEFSEDKVEEGVKRGDIVWAKYGSHPFWPAVVKSSYRKLKQRKVTLVFLGPEKWQRYIFPVVYNKSSIKPFCAAFKDLEGDSIGTDVHLDVREAIEQAQDFYRKRALGEVEVETAMEYFFGKEEPTEESPDAKQSEYANEDTSTMFTCKSDSESDEESMIMQNAEDIKFCEMPSKLVNSVKKRNNQNRKLVDFIQGDIVKDYLIKVIKGVVPSKWLEEYNEDPLTRQQSRTRKMAYRFGPLTDDQQIDEITDYLKKLEVEHLSKGEVPADINYVLDVLFPEAIIYSFTKMKKISKQKALEKFLKGPRRFKEECKMIKREILYSASSAE